MDYSPNSGPFQRFKNVPVLVFLILVFLGFVKLAYFVAFWQHIQLKPVLADAEATLLAVQREIEDRS